MKRNKFLILFGVFVFLACPVVAFAAEGDGLFSGLASIAQFLKNLIVPNPDYFHNKLAALSGQVNEKLGGVAYLFQMLREFFAQLNSAPTAGIVFQLPDNFFFGGYRGMSMDLFSGAKPYVGMLRNVGTAAFCVLTAIVCYHKLRAFFRS